MLQIGALRNMQSALKKQIHVMIYWNHHRVITVKLGDKEQIGVKELFTDYQPFYTINQLLDKELLPI